MKIFLAGASGAIGSQLTTELVARGHEVVGTTRSAAKTDALRALGAEPVVVDALDPESVADAVAKAEPEAIVHQLTALSGPTDFRRAKQMAAATDRLRTVGTDHLLAAARAVGVRRFVAQSNAMWMERAGGRVVDENGRIEPNPPADAEETVAALRHVEAAVTGITWAEGSPSSSAVLRLHATARGTRPTVLRRCRAGRPAGLGGIAGAGRGSAWRWWREGPRAGAAGQWPGAGGPALLTAMSVVAPHGGVRIQIAEVNGLPGAMMFDSQDRLFGVLGLDIVDGEIQAIHSIVNPDKLRHLYSVSDLGAQIRAGRRHRDS